MNVIKTTTIIASLLFTVFVAEAAPPGASESRRCEARGTILKYLSRQYAEKPVAMGLAKNGGLIEVLTSHDGDTFTIIVTSPDGKTCMVAAGEGWEPLAGRPAPHS